MNEKGLPTSSVVGDFISKDGYIPNRLIPFGVRKLFNP